MVLKYNTKSKGEMHIKLAEDSDASAIYDLALIASSDETVPAMFDYMGENLVASVNDGNVNDQIIVAYANEELIGILDFNNEDEFLRIRSLYVRKDYRREGVASALVKAIDKLVTTDKTLRVTAVSEGGAKFWMNLGYKVHYWEMIKKLT